jgi:hypothetical protein
MRIVRKSRQYNPVQEIVAILLGDTSALPFPRGNSAEIPVSRPGGFSAKDIYEYMPPL